MGDAATLHNSHQVALSQETLRLTWPATRIRTSPVRRSPTRLLASTILAPSSCTDYCLADHCLLDLNPEGRKQLLLSRWSNE